MRRSFVAILMVVSTTALLIIAGCTADDSAHMVEDTAVTEPTSTAEPEPQPGPIAVTLADLNVDLEPVLDGFDQPLFVTSAGDGSGRLFVLEKGGLTWVIENDERTDVFLDITDLVSTDSERGLLGMAFPPDFADGGYVYVDYTDLGGTTTVSRFGVHGNDVDRDSEEKLLTIEQPYANHNGGMIAFGPDGYLYIGMGDGGSADDPEGNGQNPKTLLGAILRIDVSSDSGYTIPADNPFADGAAGAPEVWAYGLRNPWRFSFDREFGNLWIGDVGQDAWEEIDFQPRSSIGGENYGWNTYEGTHPYPPEASAEHDDLVMPVVEYDHETGQSVTGGYVYRGSSYPDMSSFYFFGDFTTGKLWAGRVNNSATCSQRGKLETRLMLETGLSLVSFGEDDDGELYVVDFNGALYKLTGE